MPRVIRNGVNERTLVDADMTNLTVGMSIPLQKNDMIDPELFTVTGEKEIVAIYNESLADLDFERKATVLKEHCEYRDGHNNYGLVMTELLVPLKDEENYVKRFFINKTATLLACATSNDNDRNECIRRVFEKMPSFAVLKKKREVQRLKKFNKKAKAVLSEAYVKYWHAVHDALGYDSKRTYHEQNFTEADLNELLKVQRWTKRSVDGWTRDFIEKAMPRVLKNQPDLGKIETFKYGDHNTDAYANDEDDFAHLGY